MPRNNIRFDFNKKYAIFTTMIDLIYSQNRQQKSAPPPLQRRKLLQNYFRIYLEWFAFKATKYQQTIIGILNWWFIDVRHGCIEIILCVFKSNKMPEKRAKIMDMIHTFNTKTWKSYIRILAITLKFGIEMKSWLESHIRQRSIRQMHKCSKIND